MNNRYYALIPNSYTTGVEGMRIKEISSNIHNLLDGMENGLAILLTEMYDVLNIKDIEFTDLQNYVNQDEVYFVHRAKYKHSATAVGESNLNKEVNFSLIFHTVTGAWRTELFETSNKALFTNDSDTNNVTMYSSLRFNTELYLQKLQFTRASKADAHTLSSDDTKVVCNHQYLDTGALSLTEDMKKRFREVQFAMYNRSGAELSFYTDFAIDGKRRQISSEYVQRQITDPGDPDFGTIYIEKVSTPNLELEGDTILDYWELDSSAFPEAYQTKIRHKISGKGYLPQMKLISKNEEDYELAKITWISRVMNAR